MTEYNGVDEMTGELLNEYLAHDDEKREKKFKKERLTPDKVFWTIYADAWRAADLSRHEARVLTELVDLIDARGRVIASLAEIAEMVGVARTSAWRIVDGMVARDILRRRGRADLYINPNIIWKGRLSDRAACRVRWINEMDAKKDGRAA